MASNDDTLTISITADATEATANMSDVVGVLNRIEAELGSLATAQETTSGAAKEHAESETILGAAIGKVETATNSAARAFGALGLQTGEATERVLVLTEALDALEASAGPLLLVGAAFLAIGAAVNFAREGIASAAQEQSEFIEMQAGVQNAHGNWDEARESIEQFATALQNATTFSRGEAIAAIDSLTASGISLSDSEKIVAVSTDIAAAKHRSLQEVVDTLKAAEAGRGRGLEELDPKIRKLVESHASMSQILEFLSQQYEGRAAAATDTYAGKQLRLRNEVELLGTEIGTVLLPALENATDWLIGMTKAAEDSANAIGSLFKVIGDANAQDTTGFGDTGFNAKAQAAASKDTKGLIDAATKALHDDGAPDMAAWRKYRDADLKHLDYNPDMGRDPKARRARSGESPTPIEPLGDDNLTKIDGETQSEKNLLAVLSALTAQQEPYKTAVELTTDAEEKRTAQLEQAKNAVADAQLAIRLITAENANLTAAVKTDTAEEAAHLAAVNSTAAAYKTYAASINNVTATKAQREAVEALKKAHEDAVKAYDASVTAIAKLNGEIDKNNNLLDTQKQRLQDVAKVQAQQAVEDQKAYDEAAKKIAAVQAAYDADTEKTAERRQGLADEQATYKQSLDMQLAYYQARYAVEVAANRQYSDEAENLQAKIESLELDEYKKRVDDHEAFVKSWTDGEGKMLDDVLTKHESFSDRMKDIWQSLLGDWEKMLEEMVLKSSILGGINSEFFKIFGSGGGIGAGTAGGIASGSGVGATASNGGFSGMLQQLIGSGGSQQQGVPAQLTDDSIQKLTGNTTGLADGFSGTTVYGAAGTYSDGGIDGTPSSLGDVVGGGFTSSSSLLQSLFGKAMTGAGFGAIAAGLDGGNSLYGSALGGIGGAVGGLFGGSLGSTIGGAAGGLIGSLLGPHWGDPSNYPDRSDTQRFGQTVADLQGTMGANGQSFYEDTATKSAFNGATGLAGVEKILASGSASTIEAETGLNPDQYAKAMAMFGASASGSGKLNFGTHIGEEWVSGASGAGSHFQYTDAGSLLQQIESGLGSGSGSQAIPTFDVTRTNANPNLTKLLSTGSYTDVAASLLGATNAADATDKATVQVTINGNVVGPGGMDAIATTIAKSLQRVNNGLIPGSSVQRGGRTLVGQN